MTDTYLFRVEATIDGSVPIVTTVWAEDEDGAHSQAKMRLARDANKEPHASGITEDDVSIIRADREAKG